MTLGIIAAVLVVSALVLALAAMRHWRLRYESLESSVVALRREVGLAASISARTGRRVQRVEHDYSGVADRVDLVESRVTPSAIASGSLDQAIDSARCGADARGPVQLERGRGGFGGPLVRAEERLKMPRACQGPA
jgi:hypothetical protein